MSTNRTLIHVTRIALGLLLTACGGGSDSPTPPGPPVGALRVDPGALTLAVGGQGTLSAIITDGSGAPIAGAKLSWTSRNPVVASVTSTGTVTGIVVGQTMVVASAGGKSDSATVIVLDDLVLAVSPATASIQVGASAPFTVIARNGAGQVLTTPPITWRSSSPGIATISSAGMATGVARGVTLITASARSVTSAPVQLTVDDVASACDGIASNITFNGTLDYNYAIRKTEESGSLIDATYSGNLIATLSREPWVPGIPTVLWSGPITGAATHRETQTDPDGNLDFKIEGAGPMIPILPGQPPRMSMIVDLPTCTFQLFANATMSLTRTEFGTSTNMVGLTAQMQAGRGTPLGSWRNGIMPSLRPFDGHSVLWSALSPGQNAFMPLGLAIQLMEGSPQEPAVGTANVLWILIRP